MIVPPSPLPRRFIRTLPKRAAAGSVLRRYGPAAVGSVGGFLVAVVILSDLAATARLISPAIAFWTGAASLALMLVVGLVGWALERFRLIDKAKSADSVGFDAPVAPSPPPINELAPAIDQAPAKPQAIGGLLPETISGAGRKASWRLEGEFDWRPSYDEAPPDPR